MKSNKNDDDDDDFQQHSSALLGQYQQSELEYLKFILFPDEVAPCRVPKLFPIPTHIWKHVGSEILTALDGQLYVAFTPKQTQYRAFVTTLAGVMPAMGQLGGDDMWNVHLKSQDASWTGPGGNGEFVDITFKEILPNATMFDKNSAAIIGGFLKLTYIGEVVEKSGTVELGIQIDNHQISHVLNNPLASALGIKYVRPENIKNTWMYKMIRGFEGARCVYFPINQAMIEDMGHLNQSFTYHIHVQGGNPDPGAYRIDYEIFYEGTPVPAYWNILLPQISKSGNVKNVLDFSQIAMHASSQIKQSNEKSFSEMVYDGLTTGVKTVAPHVGKIITNYLGIPYLQQIIQIINQFYKFFLVNQTFK